MSGSHDDHGHTSTAHAAHDDHDDHDAHGHDEQLPPEPQTPLWFTLLGGALFITAGLVFLVMNHDDTAPAAAAKKDEKPAAPTANAPPIRAIDSLSPADRKRLQDALAKEMKGRGNAGQPPAPVAPQPVAPIPVH